jgi:hypothetical protein
MRSWYLLNKELVRPQSWSGIFGEERNLVIIKHYPAHSQDIVPITLPYLCERACHQFGMSGYVSKCMIVETCLIAKFPGFLGRIRNLNWVRMC